MRQFSFANLFLLLSALLTVAFAQDVYTTYYTTYTTTRTVYLVKTQTLTGTAPTGMANATAAYTGTAGAAHPTGLTGINASSATSGAAPTSSQAFTGGAASLHTSKMVVAAIVASLGLLAL